MNRLTDERVREGEYLPANAGEEPDPVDTLPDPWTSRFLPMPLEPALREFLRVRAQFPRGSRPRRVECPWHPRGWWTKGDEILLSMHTLFHDQPVQTFSMLIATPLFFIDGYTHHQILRWVLHALGLS